MWSPFDNANGARNTLPRKKLKKTLSVITEVSLSTFLGTTRLYPTSSTLRGCSVTVYVP